MYNIEEIQDGFVLCRLMRGEAVKGFVYTQQCGWINLSHASAKLIKKLYQDVLGNRDTVDPRIKQRLKQINVVTLDKLRTVTQRVNNKNHVFSSQQGISILPDCFRHWHDFYIIKYPIDSDKRSLNGYFCIKKDLNLEQKHSVALAILMKCLNYTEITQQYIKYIEYLFGITDISVLKLPQDIKCFYPFKGNYYGIESIISNLFGFNIIAGNNNIIKLSKPVTINEARYIWKNGSKPGTIKNGFLGNYLVPTHNLIDSVSGLRHLPSYLTQIKPAKEGELFTCLPFGIVDLINLTLVVNPN